MKTAAAPAEIPGLYPEPEAPVREVLCVDEVAAWFCVDRKTVYNAAARGEIPHQRLGKRILFSRAALVSWLAREGGARRKEARDERTTG
jgi:excisionase family DNA binding protein